MSTALRILRGQVPCAEATQVCCKMLVSKAPRQIMADRCKFFFAILQATSVWQAKLLGSEGLRQDSDVILSDLPCLLPRAGLNPESAKACPLRGLGGFANRVPQDFPTQKVNQGLSGPSGHAVAYAPSCS